MKQPRKPPEQLPFVIILARNDGRRFRNVILANDADEARAKAGEMAAMLAGRFAVMHVRPIVGGATTWHALARLEAMAAGEARARESERAARAG